MKTTRPYSRPQRFRPALVRLEDRTTPTIVSGTNGNDVFAFTRVENSNKTTYTINDGPANSSTSKTFAISGNGGTDVVIIHETSANNTFEFLGGNIYVGDYIYTNWGLTTISTWSVDGGLGNDTLIGPTADTTWNINAGDSGTFANNSFIGFETIVCGNGSDTFNFTMPPFPSGDSIFNPSEIGHFSGLINGGKGKNTFDIALYPNYLVGPNVTNLNSQSITGNLFGTGAFPIVGSFKNITTINDVAQSILGPDSNSQWNVFGPGNVSVGGTGNQKYFYSLSGVVDLVGGSGFDHFVMAPPGSVGGSIDGGGGNNDLLNYSPYQSDVAVNLALGTATGVGGALDFGRVVRIESITGGGGFNSLYGNELANIFDVVNYGNAIIIGGGGNDGIGVHLQPTGKGDIVIGVDYLNSQSNINIYGTNQDDSFVKTWSGGITYVNWKPIGEVDSWSQVSYQDALLDRVLIDALSGNDSITQEFINYGSIERTTLSGGTGDDAITIRGSVGLVTAEGGAGSDKYIVDIETVFYPVNVYELNSSTGNDSVTINGTPTADSIKVQNSKTVITSWTTNTPRLVNLVGGGVDGVVVFGGDGNDQLTGCDSGSVLVGGNGNDTLNGGAGRDVVVGGAGADQLFGNAGDDLLIGNATPFDGDEASLKMIYTEWTSSQSFAARIANLMPMLSVFVDDAIDTLTGGSGSDWFFGDSLDIFIDASGTDQITRY